MTPVGLEFAPSQWTAKHPVHGTFTIFGGYGEGRYAVLRAWRVGTRESACDVVTEWLGGCVLGVPKLFNFEEAVEATYQRIADLDLDRDSIHTEEAAP